MLAPLKWIKDYVKINTDAKTLADKMIMTGNGVEGIEELGKNIINVVVGQIEKIKKHPNAEKLVICMINVGDEELLQIVTGATNVFEGAYVPVAKAVATLPTGIIKKGKLRGEDSFGMLCSGDELNITEADYKGAGVDGIMILEGEQQAGQDIRDVLGLSGSIIEFEVGANRPDCLSILGIAREAAAATDEEFNLPCIDYTVGDKNVADYVSVEIKDTDLCTRYMAGAAYNVKIESSPEWLKIRLKEAGIRPINNIVDITNFVMIETGQPMHAFDAREIDKIIVRRGEQGEKLITLDKKEHTLTKEMLIICDKDKPIGLAGIMGGLNSEIKDDTKTVIFESAKFMYGNVRQTSRALGVSTESSMRFSKSVDAVTTEFALKRALHLVQELNAGEIAADIIDVLNEDISNKRITTHTDFINKKLGMQLSTNDICKLLNKVNIQTGAIGKEINCTIPSYRGDVFGGSDIAEEVARMYGYDNIEPADFMCELKSGKISDYEIKKDIIKKFLSDNGFNEIITYSFVGEQTFEKLGVCMPKSIKIINPLGDDTAYMRTTLVPHMLDTLTLNYNHKNIDLALFEIAMVYKPSEEPLPEEIPTLALCYSGKKDFYELKDVIEDIVKLISGKSIDCTPIEMVCLHPGISANLWIDGEEIGFIGAINPKLNLDMPVVIAQINLAKLFECKKEKIKFKVLPKYPAATRDIAVIVDENLGAGLLEKEIMIAGGKRIESVHLFDVYKSMQIGEDKKSLAYAITMRSDNGTLTDEEVDVIMKKVLKKLQSDFGAKLRD